MVSEAFEEMMDRFEDDVDTSDIHSYDQMLLQVEMWAGQKWKSTPKQIHNFKEYAKREYGLTPEPVRTRGAKIHREPYHREYHYRTPYHRETITRNGKQYTICRAPNGRFTKP